MHIVRSTDSLIRVSGKDMTKVTFLHKTKKTRRTSLHPNHGVCQFMGGKLSDQFPPKAGLGDFFGSIVGAIGMTEKRWIRLKGLLLKKSVNCGCKDRRKALNTLGKAFGLGAGEIVDSLGVAMLDDMESQPAFHCEKFGKCLPVGVVIPKPARQSAKKIGYHSCRFCNEFLATSSSDEE